MGAAVSPSGDDSESLRFSIRPGSLIVRRIYIVAMAAVVIAVDLAVVVSPPSVSVVTRAIIVVLWTGGGAVLIVWLERCMVRPTVVARADGLYIFNGMREHYVPWAEVEGFEYSARPFLMAVKRHHGEPIAMAAITPGVFGKRAQQREEMTELESYWRRVQLGERDERQLG